MPDEPQSASLWSILKTGVGDFIEDDALTQAGAVAYFTALSFAPLLVLVTIIFAAVAGESGKEKVMNEIQSLMGSGVGQTVEEIQKQADDQGDGQGSGGGLLTQIIGIGALVYSASGVFAQLQAAMNIIWDVQQAPGNGIIAFIRKRLLSVGVVFSILFMLLVSLAITTTLNVVLGGSGDETTRLWGLLNFAISMGVYIVLFAMLFKFLPDVTIPWRAVWFGATFTAVLFAIGKWAIGLYLAKVNVGENYGGAGSLVVLLVWVYYASVIVFLGAELTQAWAKARGMVVTPEEHAQPIERKKKESAHGESSDPAQLNYPS